MKCFITGRCNHDGLLSVAPTASRGNQWNQRICSCPTSHNHFVAARNYEQMRISSQSMFVFPDSPKNTILTCLMDVFCFMLHQNPESYKRPLCARSISTSFPHLHEYCLSLSLACISETWSLMLQIWPFNRHFVSFYDTVHVFHGTQRDKIWSAAEDIRMGTCTSKIVQSFFLSFFFVRVWKEKLGCDKRCRENDLWRTKPLDYLTEVICSSDSSAV